MARRIVPHAAQGGLFDPPPRKPGFASPPGAYVGPVSQVTGGPLNAIEAERVTRGASIAYVGRAYQDKRVTCRAHSESWLEGAGYYMHIFSGTNHDAEVGRCATCGVPIVGDPPDV